MAASFLPEKFNAKEGRIYTNQGGTGIQIVYKSIHMFIRLSFRA